MQWQSLTNQMNNIENKRVENNVVLCKSVCVFFFICQKNKHFFFLWSRRPHLRILFTYIAHFIGECDLPTKHLYLSLSKYRNEKCLCGICSLFCFVRVTKENKAKRHTIVRLLRLCRCCCLFQTNQVTFVSVVFGFVFQRRARIFHFSFVESAFFFPFQNILLASEG